MINLCYTSVDGCYRSATFKTLAGARRFAQKWVGETPDVGSGSFYAVSFDGVGKVSWQGVTARELFPALAL